MKVARPEQPRGLWNDETLLWRLCHGDPLPDGRTGWRCDMGHGRVLFVADGFECDGASVPRPAWAAIGHPLSWRLLAAAVAHDAGYAGRLLPRLELDEVFYYHLRHRMSRVKAWVCWMAVAAGGWVHWGRHTEEGVAAARALCWVDVVGPAARCAGPGGPNAAAGAAAATEPAAGVAGGAGPAAGAAAGTEPRGGGL
jgi:hypothetical protein